MRAFDSFLTFAHIGYFCIVLLNVVHARAFIACYTVNGHNRSQQVSQILNSFLALGKCNPLLDRVQNNVRLANILIPK